MTITAIDVAVVAVMLLAIIRGMFIGMIRESFSVAAIGAVVIGAVYGAGPAGIWLDNATAGEIGGTAAKVLGGVGAGLFAGVVVGTAGRYLRRGARMVGLGMADRAGGALVGAAEGAVIALIMLAGASRMFGPDHPAVFNAYSVAVLEEIQTAVETGTAPQLPGRTQVASGPPKETGTP